jgi:cytoskeletal protein CcmA (bactofilin family)
VFGKTMHGSQPPAEGPLTPALPTNSSAPAPSYQQGSGSSSQPKRLTVGPGISLSGEITDCDRLVVQGEARVRLHRVRTIEIAQTGRFTEGQAEVEEADIAGVYEGKLIVRGRLLVRGTGQVTGTVHYGELELERGGRLAGSVGVREPLRGLGSDQAPERIVGNGKSALSPSALEGSSATASPAPASNKTGLIARQGGSSGDDADQEQLPKTG